MAEYNEKGSVVPLMGFQHGYAYHRTPNHQSKHGDSAIYQRNIFPPGNNYMAYRRAPHPYQNRYSALPTYIGEYGGRNIISERERLDNQLQNEGQLPMDSSAPNDLRNNSIDGYTVPRSTLRQANHGIFPAGIRRRSGTQESLINFKEDQSFTNTAHSQYDVEDGSTRGSVRKSYEGTRVVGSNDGQVSAAPSRPQGDSPNMLQRAGKKSFRNRRPIAEESNEKEFVEEITSFGLQTFQRLVVLSDLGRLGTWTGYQWKGRIVANLFFVKLCHDMEGRLWCINEQLEVGKLMKHGYKNYGFLGNQELLDIAFDANNTLWGVNRMGEILKWNGFNWEFVDPSGFHKIVTIAFDRNFNFWAINSASEVAVWDSKDKCWDYKEIPMATRITTLEFDMNNTMWALGTSGQLLLLSGDKFVNYGWVGCWKLKDISFRKPPCTE